MLCAKPSAHPGCKKPEGNDHTQWTFIPESFQGWDDLTEGHSGCACRSRDCRDFVGLIPSVAKVPAHASQVRKWVSKW